MVRIGDVDKNSRNSSIYITRILCRTCIYFGWIMLYSSFGHCLDSSYVGFRKDKSKDEMVGDVYGDVYDKEEQ